MIESDKNFIESEHVETIHEFWLKYPLICKEIERY